MPIVTFILFCTFRETQARGAPGCLQTFPQQNRPGYGGGHHCRPSRIRLASESEGLDGRVQDWFPANGERNHVVASPCVTCLDFLFFSPAGLPDFHRLERDLCRSVAMILIEV